jgi:ferredoxin/menaquinone-dependent protoporphyrinogen IX oxidase
MKIGLIYFSATGNTGRVAKVIKDSFEKLGMEVDGHDITPLSNRQKIIEIGSYHAIVFGCPVHSLRAPKIMREWMRTLDGQGKKCSMFFTYGGFTVHPAHHSTRQILTEQNFTVVSSAEFPGAHTFNHGGWQAFTDRPDESDFDMAKEYTIATLKRFSGKDPSILGELDKSTYSKKELDNFESLRFRIITNLPSRDGKDCSLCMACEKSCPTGAMDAKIGLADNAKCIACLGCVAICPEQALSINDTRKSWNFKLDLGKTTEKKLNMQQGRIYL